MNGSCPARSILVLVCGSLLLACGGSKSVTPEDAVALCKQGCAKSNALCFADAGATGVAAEALCEGRCTTDAPGKSSLCTNSAAIITAVKVCLARTSCNELETCTATIPACASGGSGGSQAGTGGGGSGGTLGSGGAVGTGGAGARGTGGQSGAAGVGGARAGGTGGFTFDGSIPGFDGAIPTFDAGTGTCADLLACCNAISSVTTKAACLAAYNQLKPSGDANCGSAYAGLKQAGTCP